MKINHELVVFENGEISLKDLALGETMHSKIGPWDEANAIYVEQSGLATRLESQDESAPSLVLFDVGLGLAANSLAALECRNRLVQTGKKVRKLRIISFENDLSGLRLALNHRDQFPFFSGFEGILEELLSQGFWKSKDQEVGWELREGDFQKWVEEGFGEKLSPEIIFYDFYSPKSQPQLWKVEYFKALRKIAAPDAVLVTYSVATSVRVAMVLGGFILGQGIRTPAKLETTVAAIRVEVLAQPLGEEWLEKLRRSPKILPFGFREEDREKIIHEVSQLFFLSLDKRSG